MFSGTVIAVEGNILVLEGKASVCGLLTGLPVVAIELWFSVVCWGL